MGQGKSKLSHDDLAELQKQTYFNRRELNQYVHLKSITNLDGTKGFSRTALPDN